MVFHITQGTNLVHRSSPLGCLSFQLPYVYICMIFLLRICCQPSSLLPAERIAEPILICGFGLWHHSPSNGNPQTFHLIEMQYLGKYFAILIVQDTLGAHFTF